MYRSLVMYSSDKCGVWGDHNNPRRDLMHEYGCVSWRARASIHGTYQTKSIVYRVSQTNECHAIYILVVAISWLHVAVPAGFGEKWVKYTHYEHTGPAE